MKSTARRRNLLSLDLLLVILAVLTGVNGLHNVSVEIPEAVAVGSTVTLTCHYDLQTDVLYAVKWYKGKDEFYRYVPKEFQRISGFGELFTNNVDISKSDAYRVTLTNVTSDLEGKYRCEVSNDPHFHTLLKAGYMHVVNLPQGKPEVLVEKQRYAIADTVKANCTTPPSNPPANVTWTVNGVRLNSTYQRNIQLKVDNRSKTYAELDFEITQDKFSNGRLKITCHANVFQLYDEESTVQLDEERPRLAPVLGTRDSPHPNEASKHTAKWLCMVIAANLLLGGLR
ncbi:cell adhesion molecule 3-like [Chelonus insularis]|uniref:cell adhesion molecule 3-like n=1 Tax=Chelonus insularis TaxID=460826 RepID=UPI00158C4B22|nr:cell adhesion molecule 3-like [Chelonus insularis]